MYLLSLAAVLEAASMFEVIAGIAALVALAIWLRYSTWKAGEPQMMKYSVPFLGHALAFAKDKRSLLTWGRDVAGGKPFTLLIAGRKFFVFWEAADVSFINRNPNLMSMAGFVEILQRDLFGMSHDQAARHKGGYDWTHGELKQFIIDPTENTKTTARYFVALDKEFKEFDKQFDTQKTVTINLLDMIRDVQGKATSNAYFGERLHQANPHILEDLQEWLKHGFWGSLAGVPKIFMPKAVNARQRCLEAIEVIIKEKPADRSAFVTSHWETRNLHGWEDDMQKHDLLGFLFGIQGNSIPTCYSALLRILQTPGILSEVRAELSSINYSSLNPTEHTQIIPSQVPLLRAIWWENLRYAQTAMTIREVLKPTTIRGYTLPVGSVVTIPGALAHRDPTIHPEPATFRPKRFLAKQLGGDGQNSSIGVRAFGGGQNMCPGRIFAEKQVIATLARIVWNYDVRFVKGEGQFPEELDFEYVMRLPDVFVELRRRAKA